MSVVALEASVLRKLVVTDRLLTGVPFAQSIVARRTSRNERSFISPPKVCVVENQKGRRTGFLRCDGLRGYGQLLLTVLPTRFLLIVLLASASIRRPGYSRPQPSSVTRSGCRSEQL